MTGPPRPSQRLQPQPGQPPPSGAPPQPPIARTLAVPPPGSGTLAAPPPSGRLASVDPATLGAPGRRIGKYEVVKELGRGGMGVVLVVRDPELDRTLAMKLILGDADEEAVKRFGREAQVMARVKHRNVVGIHELGRAPEGPFIVSDLVEGEGLHARIRRGPLDPREAAAIVRGVSDGLAACHAAGVVHRDLKPHNIIVQPDGTPVVLDFGIARDETAERMTRTGQVMGTPNYMAPEQADGSSPGTIDGRADVYGLGAILFDCLAGRPPFHDATSVTAVLTGVCIHDPVWPSATNPAVPVELEAIVKVAMAKEKAARHPTAAALRDDLDRFLRGERPWAADRVPTPRRRRVSPALVAAGSAGLILAVCGGVALAIRGREAGARVEPAQVELDAAKAVERTDPAEALRLIDAWVTKHGRDHRLYLAAMKVQAAARPLVAKAEAANRELDEALKVDDPRRRLERLEEWARRHGETSAAARGARLREEAARCLPTCLPPEALVSRAELEKGKVVAVWTAALDDARGLIARSTGGVSLVHLDPARPREERLDGVLEAPKGVVVGLAIARGGARALLLEDRVVDGGHEVAVHVVDVARRQVEKAWTIGRLRPASLAATDDLVAIGCVGGVVIVAGHDGADQDRGCSTKADEVTGLAFHAGRLFTLTQTAFDQMRRAERGSEGDNALRCWEPRSGRQVGPPVKLDSAGTALAFSPDGAWAVAGSGNGNLYKVSLGPEGLVDQQVRFAGKDARFEAAAAGFTRDTFSHSGDVRGIAFAGPTSFVTVSGRLSKGRPPERSTAEMRRWDLERATETLLDRLEGPGELVRRRPYPLVSLAVTPDRRRLLAGNAAGQVEVWTVD